MLKPLFTGPVSACFELVNESPYYAPAPYALFLNGERAGEGDANVFSLFDLAPGREYRLRLRYEGGGEEAIRFRTSEETCCLDVGVGAGRARLEDEDGAPGVLVLQPVLGVGGGQVDGVGQQLHRVHQIPVKIRLLMAVDGHGVFP